jgi:hypothetical protein
LLTKIKCTALSISLLLLFVLFTVQFLLGMAQNLLVMLPMTTFPQNDSSFLTALSYVITNGNLVLNSHFFIDIALIVVGAVNFVLVIHKSNVYKVFSILGFISILYAFVSGVRFAASNFNTDAISFEMAAGFILAFITYFVLATLINRDNGAHA